MIPEQHRKKAGWAAIAVVAVSGFEGVRTVAYRDPVGIPTVCFGETRGVKLGQRYTLEQCKDMLIPRLEEFNAGVNKCVHAPMSDERRAAVVSFTYNIGVGGLCKSSFARRLNEGDPNACDALLQYSYARGIYLPGLANRRKAERKLCMEG